MGALYHPFVVWGSCFLWLTSMCGITWSLVLFFCFGDMLLITGTDLVIALLLLSGIIMLPTNVFMLYTIANGQRIDHRSKVLCCPLWILMLWIIVVNCIGIGLCIHRICWCSVYTEDSISHCMMKYRTEPRYKHFMDNLQWSLKCCGIDSYKDWFHHDWYEKIRDYEWNPTKNKSSREDHKDTTVPDSVPLSCCKSGTCMPNYLLELGTHSIHTRGCNDSMYRIYMITMNVHLLIFFLIVLTEVVILACIIARSDLSETTQGKRKHELRHILAVNKNFIQSSGSSACQDEDSEEN